MKTILLTRPQMQAEKLSQKLEKHGYKAIIFPTISIVSNPDKQALKEITTNLKQYDMAIFISPNAVTHIAPWIKLFPSHVEIFAIGPGTAKTIEEQNWGIAKYPEQYNSEGLLKLPQLQMIKDKIILVCRGQGGDTKLIETLRTRQATVVEAIVYQRQLSSPEQLPLLANIDRIVCTSQETLHNLVQLFGPQHWQQLRNKLLIVSSKRLQDLARSLGFTVQPILAKDASDEAILATLNNE